MRLDRIIVLAGIVSGILTFASCGTNTGSEDSVNNLKGALAESLPDQLSIDFINMDDGGGYRTNQDLEVEVIGMSNVSVGDVKDEEGHIHIMFNEGFAKKGLVLEANGQEHLCLNGETNFKVMREDPKLVITAQFVDSKHRSYGERLSRSVKIFNESNEKK